MNIEAVVLTGGRSERMGVDKAELDVDGEALGARTARLLSEAGYTVSVLGRAPIEGFRFLEDRGQFEGPLSALSNFQPTEEAVFVAGCDMPRFDARIIQVLANFLENSDAAIPCIGAQMQPTCGLYRSMAWPKIEQTIAQGKRSLMAWIDSISPRKVSENELRRHGLDPADYRNANTPDEFRAITGSA